MRSRDNTLGVDGQKHPVHCRWYTKIPSDISRMDLIESTALQIARENNCIEIRIRSDIHNTTGVLIEAENLTSPCNGQVSKRTANVAALGFIKETDGYIRKNARIVSEPSNPQWYGSLKKVFVEAPWHYTVEFKKRTKGWISAHVYTNTVAVLDAMGDRKFKTTGLSKLTDEVKQNPQMWDRNRPSHGSKTYREVDLE